MDSRFYGDVNQYALHDDTKIEIYAKIFSYLTPKEIFSIVFLIDKQLYQLAKSNELWKKQVEKDFPESYFHLQPNFDKNKITWYSCYQGFKHIQILKSKPDKCTSENGFQLIDETRTPLDYAMIGGDQEALDLFFEKSKELKDSNKLLKLNGFGGRPLNYFVSENFGFDQRNQEKYIYYFAVACNQVSFIEAEIIKQKKILDIIHPRQYPRNFEFDLYASPLLCSVYFKQQASFKLLLPYYIKEEYTNKNDILMSALKAGIYVKNIEACSLLIREWGHQGQDQFRSKSIFLYWPVFAILDDASEEFFTQGLNFLCREVFKTSKEIFSFLGRLYNSSAIKSVMDVMGEKTCQSLIQTSNYLINKIKEKETDFDVIRLLRSADHLLFAANWLLKHFPDQMKFISLSACKQYDKSNFYFSVLTCRGEKANDFKSSIQFNSPIKIKVKNVSSETITFCSNHDIFLVILHLTHHIMGYDSNADIEDAKFIANNLLHGLKELSDMLEKQPFITFKTHFSQWMAIDKNKKIKQDHKEIFDWIIETFEKIETSLINLTDDNVFSMTNLSEFKKTDNQQLVFTQEEVGVFHVLPSEILLKILINFGPMNLINVIFLINKTFLKFGQKDILWSSVVKFFFPNKYIKASAGINDTFYFEFYKKEYLKLFGFSEFEKSNMQIQLQPDQTKPMRLLMHYPRIHPKQFQYRTKQEWSEVQKWVVEKIPDIEKMIPTILLDDQKRIFSQEENILIKSKLNEQQIKFLVMIFSTKYSIVRSMFIQKRDGVCLIDLAISLKNQEILNIITEVVSCFVNIDKMGLHNEFVLPFARTSSYGIFKMKTADRYSFKRNLCLWAAECNQMNFFRNRLSKDKNFYSDFIRSNYKTEKTFFSSILYFDPPNQDPVYHEHIESILSIAALECHNDLFRFLLNELQFHSVEYKYLVLFSALESSIYADNLEIFKLILSDDAFFHFVFSSISRKSFLSQFFFYQQDKMANSIIFNKMVFFLINVLIKKAPLENHLEAMPEFCVCAAGSISRLKKEDDKKKMLATLSQFFNGSLIKTYFLAGFSRALDRAAFDFVFAMKGSVIFDLRFAFGNVLAASLIFCDMKLIEDMMQVPNATFHLANPFVFCMRLVLKKEYTGFYCALDASGDFKLLPNPKVFDYASITAMINFDLLNILFIKTQMDYPEFFTKYLQAMNYSWNDRPNLKMFLDSTELLIAKLIKKIILGKNESFDQLFPAWEKKSDKKINFDDDSLLGAILDIYNEVHDFLVEKFPEQYESEQLSFSMLDALQEQDINLQENFSSSSSSSGDVSAYASQNMFANAHQNSIPTIEEVTDEEAKMEVDVETDDDEDCEPPKKKRRTK